MIRQLHILLAALAFCATTLAAPAQVASTELFAPVVMVNGKAVTNYELQQRILMMRLFRTPGDLEEAALEALIDDRLRMIAAERQGLSLTEEEIVEGEAEFAGRADLTREEFLQALAGAGVARETFRDFVSAGLLWRQVVRERFAPQANITEEDVDRAISVTSRPGEVQLVFSEIILPANTPANAARAQQLADEITANIRTEAAFSSYARRFSASPSRARGGRVPEPVPVGNLPGQIAEALIQLPEGGVTDPFPIPNAIAIFQLRQIIETGQPATENVALEYARFLIPGGRSEETLREAGRIRARVDTCNDLYKVAQGLPPERLTRETRSPEEVPADIALELAKLDADEVSTSLTSGNALVFLMLCGRTVAVAENPQSDGGATPESAPAPAPAPAQSAEAEDEAAEDEAPEPTASPIANGAGGPANVPTVSRGSVREQLVNRRVAALAERYLAELKADAIIQYP